MRRKIIEIIGLLMILTGIAYSHCSKALTYTDDIKPIFHDRCESCHSTSSMPDKNWMDYDIAFKAKDKIKDRVYVKKDMPLSNATNITDAERKKIADWVDEGAKK